MANTVKAYMDDHVTVAEDGEVEVLASNAYASTELGPCTAGSLGHLLCRRCRCGSQNVVDNC